MGGGGGTFCTAHVPCILESLSPQSSLIGAPNGRLCFQAAYQYNKAGDGKFSHVSNVRMSGRGANNKLQVIKAKTGRRNEAIYRTVHVGAMVPRVASGGNGPTCS